MFSATGPGTVRGGSGRLAFGAVLLSGLVLRAALIPLWHGEDFTVWDLASAATLRGSNVYAHHPAYPGGPYAYFPLFLYLELPFQWLAQHTGVTFLVWGKLPIVAADVAVAVLLHRGVRRLGGAERRATCAAAIYFLNPLVLYNSALYGRFDAVACALLLAWLLHAAAGRGGSWRATSFYGLAVVAKTFPLFLIAAAHRSARPSHTRRLVLVTGAVAVAVSLPYLITLLPYMRDLTHDAGKTAGGLSWWTVLHLIADDQWVSVVSTVGLVALGVGSVLLARRFAREDIVLCTALTLVLFLLTSKVVLEQYLTWVFAPLALLSVRPTKRTALSARVMLGFLTAVGLIDTESFHPFGRTSIVVGVVLGLGCGAYLTAMTMGTRSRDRRRPRDHEPGRRRVPASLGWARGRG